MKEGLLGDTLQQRPPRSELEEARLHVARWIGSESKPARCLSAVGRRRAGRGSSRRRRTTMGCAACAAGLGARRAGARGDRVDDRRAVSCTTRWGGYGWDMLIADAQKVKGLAPLACKTDRIDAQVLGGALAARARAGDLAARPGGARASASRRASGSTRQAPLDAQAPDPLDVDHVRPAETGDAICSASPATNCSIARDPAAGRFDGRREPRADRRPRASDRRDQPPSARRRRRTCLRAGADDRARTRAGAGVHDRRRDRRSWAPRGKKLVGLHRAPPAHQPVRHKRSPRPALQARAEIPALGDARSDHARAAPPRQRRLQRNKAARQQRGANVAQIDIARKLTEAIWHMLTHNEPYAPAPGGATFQSGRLAALLELRPGAGLPCRLILPTRRR